jgi:hypothetical protein
MVAFVTIPSILVVNAVPVVSVVAGVVSGRVWVVRVRLLLVRVMRAVVLRVVSVVVFAASGAVLLVMVRLLRVVVMPALVLPAVPASAIVAGGRASYVMASRLIASVMRRVVSVMHVVVVGAFVGSGTAQRVIKNLRRVRVTRRS